MKHLSWTLPLLALAACTAGLDDTGMDTGEDPDLGLRFGFPVEEHDLIRPPAMGVDHDPVQYEGAWRITCTNYRGDSYPYCYDEHGGTDFILDGGFTAMDAGSATVVAAADGEVVSTDDGHYDRCHADITSLDVSCDGYEMIGNHVILEHEDGYRTKYWHFMSGSVLVEVGDEVLAGEPLGLIGSSGYSSLPHLHFGLEDEHEVAIDPYAGPYSQETSWWCEQGDPDGLPGDC
ncbi:MAG: M23 family metallopeptidase [Deltaproteobacteria bacterium]|nr:M23 family metallopeptidase [Deltaproteobacteria bacterium]MBW2257431.1 M23 family metallopeptidase [Deltaproteobacteria bacterium]